MDSKFDKKFTVMTSLRNFYHYCHQHSRYAMIFSLLVIWGPLYRTLLDKCWVLTGDLGSVGHWAQWQTSAELIAAPVATGVAMGLTVFTAQRDQRMHIPFLMISYALGLLYTLPLLLVGWVLADDITRWMGLQQQPVAWFRLAILDGWLATAVGQISSFYLGRQQHGRVLMVLLLTGLPVMAVVALGSYFAWPALPQIALVTIFVVNVLVHVYCWIQFWHWKTQRTRARNFFKIALAKLSPYIVAGFSVGMLTPLSILVVRSTIAHDLSWTAAGVSTALWRTSDWVLSTSQGVMYYHFLPLLSQHIKRGEGIAAMRAIQAKVFLPCMLVLVSLWIFRDTVLPLLYDHRLQVSWQVAALFWSGDILRVSACIYLIGLYSMHATRAITIWDLFSQPLFALLLVLGAAGSMLSVGSAYLITYLIYCVMCMGSYLYLAKPAQHKMKKTRHDGRHMA